MSARLARGVAGAALLIAAITALARAVGFGRYLVQAQTLGNGCLNSAYSTANFVPNVVFELVAGGALAGMVVPILAGGAADPARRAETGRTASALLTWVTLILLPLTLLVAVLTAASEKISFTRVIAGNRVLDKLDMLGRRPLA